MGDSWNAERVERLKKAWPGAVEGLDDDDRDYEDEMNRRQAEGERNELAQAIAWSEMGFEGTGV